MSKEDTIEKMHYFTQADAHELVSVHPTNMRPQIRQIENSTTYPQQVGHLPLSIPPAATENNVF